MAAPPQAQSAQRSWPAILGWGGLALFSVGFVWIISAQLGESWAKKEEDAKKLVREYRPDGSDLSLQDLTKEFSIKAKERGAYVGEFTWDAKQKDGPEYEVTLLWKEGEQHHVAIWRANLKTQEVRAQGDEANSLPRRAKTGGAG
jgi:hypothetical protein